MGESITRWSCPLHKDVTELLPSIQVDMELGQGSHARAIWPPMLPMMLQLISVMIATAINQAASPPGIGREVAHPRRTPKVLLPREAGHPCDLASP